MPCNVGNAERIIRFLVAALALPLAILVVAPPFNIVLGVIGAIALITGIASFCPLWTLFGINTCKTS